MGTFSFGFLRVSYGSVALFDCFSFDLCRPLERSLRCVVPFLEMFLLWGRFQKTGLAT